MEFSLSNHKPDMGLIGAFIKLSILLLVIIEMKYLNQFYKQLISFPRSLIIINLTYDTTVFSKFITLKIKADEFCAPLERTSNYNDSYPALFNDIALKLMSAIEVTR